MTRRGLILFGLMSIVWGIPYLFIRVAVDEIGPAVLGVLVLNETVTVLMGIGFSLVILGSTLATRPMRGGPEPRPVAVEAAALRPARDGTPPADAPAGP